LSNYTDEEEPRNNTDRREKRCQHCHGTGDDPKIEGADCIECWGYGTIEV
jgi:DnaJ-class molecular chaperone